MNIISRSAWGARSPKITPTRVAPSQRFEFVVHYSGAPVTQTVRAIQDWCMDGRSFNDIDYNFLVRGTTGELYEGRGWDVVGAHATDHNTVGYGVCVIGQGELSDAAKTAVRWLYDQACSRSARTLRIYGHRDVATTGTDCPGTTIEAWVKTGLTVKEAPVAEINKILIDELLGRDLGHEGGNDEVGMCLQGSLTNSAGALAQSRSNGSALSALASQVSALRTDVSMLRAAVAAITPPPA